jgi:hypothetical protein
MSRTAARPALTSLRTRAGSLVALGAVAAALVAAGPAHAQPKGSGPAKGCPVENSDGTTSTVAVGTQIGLFHCGSDGEWHFGWATTDLVVQPPTTVAPSGTVATASTGVRTVR